MRFSRFLVAGLANTGITYLVYLALVQLMPYATAYSLTYALGILLGYLINATWVFSQRPSASSAFRYPLAYLLNYVLGLGLLWLLVDRLRMPKQIAPLAILFITTPAMYAMTRYVFTPRNSHDQIDR
ncbi:MAG TPA: GtrA family protein [Ramlibacter sp.]|jgi:putative flippase GtrA|uniref:GtrA family protein n=1 Tax=Ramlibacter sp. TaxID=1917967 RepID=UPI002D6C965A|nr:GtrA family protein [Ramlibacter sp.]HZY20065.1 GtrA family protein [Ramlibacter sp.]